MVLKLESLRRESISTYAIIITNLISVDAFRAAVAEREGDAEKRNILFTSLPNVRTQFAKFSETFSWAKD